MDLIDLPGIGEKTLHTLNQHGISDIKGLLKYFPRTYREYVARSSRSAKAGEWVSLVGTVTRPLSRHSGRLTTQLASFRDGSGVLTLRWFNSPYVTRSINPSNSYLVRGQIEVFASHPQIVNPQLTAVNPDFIPNPTELIPIYTPMGNLKSGHLRNIMRDVLSHIDGTKDELPSYIENRFNLLDYTTAVKELHFPSDKATLESAMHRFGFAELLSLQLQALKNRELTRVPTNPLNWDTKILDHWITTLPFTPTAAQLRCLDEIKQDLRKPVAMHRLLEGEVGSGKTLVAAGAAYSVCLGNRRVLVMAPTQILAEQLHATFSQLLPNSITISLITQSSKGDNQANIIIGTQALLNKVSLFKDVGLVIIDEQHRFGVEQRLLLTTLKPAPHFLMMTATPIPRTLAMTVFSHLEISQLDELPKNRIPTKTYLVNQAKRTAAYGWVRQEVVTKHTQVFVVVPLIEQALDQEETTTKSLRELELELKHRFPGLKIDVMHGKMKAAEKTLHLQQFRDQATQILVATSIVEVGIDIPQANIMLIENAERFGLATLHQLRGRVGRGGEQGYCLVLTDNQTTKVKDRLTYFASINNGAKLAEYDLQHRGPGELFGTVQHGFFSMRFASLFDEELLGQTFDAAKLLAKSGNSS